jgi:hypothetical protein
VFDPDSPYVVKKGLDPFTIFDKPGRINIRIHRDITGEMWFGVG